MSKQLKENLIIGLIMLLCMTGIIIVSNIVRINHDAEVRQQAVQTCKEFK